MDRQHQRTCGAPQHTSVARQSSAAETTLAKWRSCFSFFGICIFGKGRLASRRKSCCHFFSFSFSCPCPINLGRNDNTLLSFASAKPLTAVPLHGLATKCHVRCSVLFIFARLEACTMVSRARWIPRRTFPHGQMKSHSACDGVRT